MCFHVLMFPFISCVASVRPTAPGQPTYKRHTTPHTTTPHQHTPHHLTPHTNIVRPTGRTNQTTNHTQHTVVLGVLCIVWWCVVCGASCIVCCGGVWWCVVCCVLCVVWCMPFLTYHTSSIINPFSHYYHRLHIIYIMYHLLYIIYHR